MLTVAEHWLLRASGLPFSWLAELTTGETARAVTCLDALGREVAERQQAVSALLHAAIGGVSDKSIRNRLLEIRRGLFNGRAASDRQRQIVRDALPSEVADAVLALDALLARRGEWMDRVRCAHEAELALTRARFREMVQDDDFRTGVLMSSSALFANLHRYAAVSLDAMTSRDEQIERGLLKYFTRATSKATPFATLCAIAKGRFVATTDEAARPTFCGNPRAKRIHARLNKDLYAVLWMRLRERPTFRAYLTVEPNPTLAREGDRFTFLVGIEVRETFRRIPATELLTLVLNHIGHGATLGSVVTALVADPAVEASADEATAFLDSLIEMGLLRFRGIVSEQDADWAPRFCAVLERTDDPAAQGVVPPLRTLDDLAHRYATATVEARDHIVEQMHQCVRDALGAVDLPPHKAWEMPVFVDASTDAVLTIPRTRSVSRALEAMQELVRLTGPLAFPVDDNATMRRFFDQHYGDSTNAVPVLRFYEDYYREHYKAHLERERQPHVTDGYDRYNPLRVERLEASRRARMAMFELLRSEWAKTPMAEEIAIAPDRLSAVLRQLPAPSVPGRSVTAFVHLVPPNADGEPTRIAFSHGSYNAGFGKFFSRFLYMMDDAFRVALVNENTALTDAYLAEIEGDAHFNANLHPPLVRWHIAYPTGERTEGHDYLETGDLEVAPNPGDPDAVMLRHRPDGRRVIPLDLGFLAMRLRPPFFQLLERFMPPTSYGLGIPETWIRPAGAGEVPPLEPVPPAIAYRPRFVYDECVVLARRLWIVPSELFPHPVPGEAPADYFVRVQRWRQEAGIPERVYVRTPPNLKPGAPPLPRVQGGRHSKDFHKPQYIDFSSPLLVNLFGRLPGALQSFSAYIEEELPTMAQVPEYDGLAYATELMLVVNERVSA